VQFARFRATQQLAKREAARLPFLHYGPRFEIGSTIDVWLRLLCRVATVVMVSDFAVVMTVTVMRGRCVVAGLRLRGWGVC
jgi:hypothetical protein